MSLFLPLANCRFSTAADILATRPRRLLKMLLLFFFVVVHFCLCIIFIFFYNLSTLNFFCLNAL